MLGGRGRGFAVRDHSDHDHLDYGSETERIGDAVVVEHEHEPKYQVPGGYPGTSGLCPGR